MELFYDDGQCAIWCGDIMDAANDPGWLGEYAGRVACTVSSPPYNVRLNYDSDDDGDWLDWADYGQLAHEAAHVVSMVSEFAARCWWNTAVSVPEHYEKDGPKRRVNLPRLWLEAFEGCGFEWVDQVAWTSMRGAGTAWGSFRQPSSPNLRGDYEVIQALCLGRWERVRPAGMGPGYQDPLPDWQNLCTSVWADVGTTRSKHHPAPYPADIPARCIRLSTWPGELVFDPFCGTGATLRAAKDLGRRSVGIERSRKYCQLAAERVCVESLGL